MNALYLYLALGAAAIAGAGYHWVTVSTLEASLETAAARNTTLDSAHNLAKEERERADASAASWRKLYNDAQTARATERAALEQMRAQAAQAAQAADRRAEAAQAALDGWRRRAAAPTAQCEALLRLPLAACGQLGDQP